MIWVNIGCGPHRAPAPWVNLDAHRGDGVEPDVLVDDPMMPLQGIDDVERVYLGHVLEHIPWLDVREFLVHIEKALIPGGQVMVVGPDVERAVRRWHEGLDPWEIVVASWEHSIPQYDLGPWPEARHHWNCTEERVALSLEAAGFVEVKAQPIHSSALGDWPVVAYTQHQCAVTAVKL